MAGNALHHSLYFWMYRNISIHHHKIKHVKMYLIYQRGNHLWLSQAQLKSKRQTGENRDLWDLRTWSVQSVWKAALSTNGHSNIFSSTCSSRTFFRVESIPKPLNPGAPVTFTMRLSLGTSTPLYLKCTYPASMFSERTQVNGTTPSVNWLQLTSIDHITQQQKNVHFSNLTWNIP